MSDVLSRDEEKERLIRMQKFSLSVVLDQMLKQSGFKSDVIKGYEDDAAYTAP